MLLMNGIGPELTPQGAGKAQPGAAGGGEAEGQSFFARLLARLGAGGVETLGDAVPGTLSGITVPGSDTEQGAALEDLAAQLDALAAWLAGPAAASVETGAPGTVGSPAPHGSGPQGNTATQAGRGGADPMQAVAQKLGALLAAFDATEGANSRAVLAANASTVPNLAVTGEGVEGAAEFLTIARNLLGLGAARDGAGIQFAAGTAATTAGTVATLASKTSVAPGAGAGTGTEAFRGLLDRVTAPDLQPQPMSNADLRAPMPAADVTPRAEAPAPPASSAPAPSSGFAANLAGQIRGTQLAEGTTRIELSPRGIGGLEIDLARDDNGGLKVTVRAENHGVLTALRENREALLAVLRDSGVTVQDAGLGFEDFGANRQGQQPMETTVSGPADPEAEDDPAPDTATPAEGRIDIMT